MRKILSDEEFVILWMESRTQQDLATKAGISQSAVSERAHKLRIAGVALPDTSWRRSRDVAALNALIAKKASEQ